MEELGVKSRQISVANWSKELILSSARFYDGLSKYFIKCDNFTKTTGRLVRVGNYGIV